MAISYKSIVLTGASSGIGEALCLRLAAPGVRLLLIARRGDELERVAAGCRARGAMVDCASVDVRDRVILSQVVLAFDDRHPIDLLIANAGVSTGLLPGHRPEAEGESRRLMEINYGGRLALVESIAALRPQPDLPSYSATKMAVRGYGIALRGWLRSFGVGVSVIYPGFVTSPMSLRHHGYKPFEMSADKAADIVARGLQRGRPIIAFPLLLAILSMLGMLIPSGLADWFNEGFRATVDPDQSAGSERK